MRRVVGLGAGGHAEILLEILVASGEWEIVGFVDSDMSRQGAFLAGTRILGDDAMLGDLSASGVKEAFLGVAGFGSSRVREALVVRAEAAGLSFPVIAHKRAWVSGSATVGAGSQLLVGAIVNTGAVLGQHVVVNTGATIDHHCVIGDFVHVAPGAVLAGRIVVGEGAQIGAGAVIRDGVRIGSRAVVGAGATVLADVAPDATVAGTPARTIKHER